MRFVVEGEWSGYTPAQRHIVHRQIIPYDRAEKLANVKMIVFNDGTYLKLNLRVLADDEQIVPLNGYPHLVSEAEQHGKKVYSVKVTA